MQAVLVYLKIQQWKIHEWPHAGSVFWRWKNYIFINFSVWLVLCWDDAGTMKQQMPLISCHYSSVASHKHIPALSRGRSQVQRYHLLVMYMSECVCVCVRVINREIKDKMGQGDWGWMTEEVRKRSMWGKSRGVSNHSSHISFLPTGAQIQVGWHCQAERADRILARPVQKIKAGQLAVMLALFCGDWRAWRTAGLLFCPVLQLLFCGCTNSSSFMVWPENQHSSYTLVPNKTLVLETGNTSNYMKISWSKGILLALF